MTDSIESSVRDWLSFQCERTPGALAGLVLAAPRAGAGDAFAVGWPLGHAVRPELHEAARAAVTGGGAVEAPVSAGDQTSPGPRAIACPFKSASGLQGSVALLLEPGSATPLAQALDRLRAATDWIDLLLRRDSVSHHLSSLLELIAVATEHEASGAVATSLATELASRLRFERVSIGFPRRGSMRVEALSHSSSFDPAASLVRDLEMAMDEAADQDATIVYPPPRGATARIVLAHERLAREHSSGAVCSVPFAHDGRIVGAICFERAAGESIGAETVRLCEDVSSLLGGVLRLALRAHASPLERAREWLEARRSDLLGPGHATLKICAGAAAAALLVLTFARADYRVVAPATLEGRIQRVVVAGIEGYIAESHARPGDLVSEGQLLGRLDDRDLLLEGRSASARREQIQKEYREAFAVHDRSKLNILRARLAQSDAELDLLAEQLARTRLLAPFDGVVVKGDLSQLLGSPVERGEVLFEIAPLNGYRIILNVDERDIAAVSEQKRGILTLSALPDQELALTVERITPVTVTDRGRNTFRVEASLDEPVSVLRPGMEGLAKVEAGRRSLFWISTHRLVDWLRLWAWSWWP